VGLQERIVLVIGFFPLKTDSLVTVYKSSNGSQSINMSSNQAINMSTQLQTVEITMPGSINITYALENYPVCPVQVPKEGSVWLDTPNGDTYMWDEDGAVSILSYGGTQRFFRKKPTIADAVYNKCEYIDSCFQFFKDGSVRHRLDTRVYWWGPTVDGVPVKGDTPRSYDDEQGPYSYTNENDEYDECDRCQSRNCSGCSEYY
jgi:hypothetical protein